MREEDEMMQLWFVSMLDITWQGDNFEVHARGAMTVRASCARFAEMEATDLAGYPEGFWEVRASPVPPREALPEGGPRFYDMVPGLFYTQDQARGYGLMTVNEMLAMVVPAGVAVSN